MPRPLVTFTVFGYNQERFIREAIEGAFAQSYEPLEIILSDDASTDRTFEFMQEMTAAYRGPHRVLLNHNERNLGLAEHINRVMKLATGQFLIMAAGDDISVPNRTQVLFDAWEKAGFASTCVYSDMDVIDIDGRLLHSAPCHSDFSALTLVEFARRPVALVCTYSLTRDLGTGFPPLRAKIRNEDFIFPFRALVRGNRLVYVDKALVKYRIGAGHMVNINICQPRDWIPLMVSQRAMFEQFRDDLLSHQPANASAADHIEQLLYRNLWETRLVEECSLLQSLNLLICEIVTAPLRSSELTRAYLRLRHPYLTSFLRRMRQSIKSTLKSCIQKRI